MRRQGGWPEIRVPQDRASIAPPTSLHDPARQRRYVHFIEQVAEKCRLGQDFDVKIRGPGLHWDGPQLLGAMEPAGRMNVKHGNREDQTPSRAGDPAPDPPPGTRRPSADDVVAPVDGIEERLKVSRRPGLDGRRDQNEGEREIIKGGSDRVVQPCGAAVERRRFEQRRYDRRPATRRRWGQ